MWWHNALMTLGSHDLQQRSLNDDIANTQAHSHKQQVHINRQHTPKYSTVFLHITINRFIKTSRTNELSIKIKGTISWSEQVQYDHCTERKHNCCYDQDPSFQWEIDGTYQINAHTTHLLNTAIQSWASELKAHIYIHGWMMIEKQIWQLALHKHNKL